MRDFLSHNWGNLASVLGLIISLWVLWVARGARKAAEDARAVARRRSLIEELEEADRRIQEIGGFVRDRKWEIVQLQSQKVLGDCRAMLARWGEHLGLGAIDLRTASTQLSSIAELAHESSLRELTAAEDRQIFKAQLWAGELVSSVLGRTRSSEERS
jgi:hypothetical protein